MARFAPDESPPDNHCINILELSGTTGFWSIKECGQELRELYKQLLSGDARFEMKVLVQNIEDKVRKIAVETGKVTLAIGDIYSQCLSPHDIV